MHEPLEGELIKNISGRPAELLGIPNHLGTQPRIIVPETICEALTMHTHEDIHHQHHQKVTHILKPLYYWPGMDRDVERFISKCETCRRGTVRHRHLKMIFDADAPLAKALPRQHYGLDFYGVLKGEILVIVDLFSRGHHRTCSFQITIARRICTSKARHSKQRCTLIIPDRQRS